MFTGLISDVGEIVALRVREEASGPLTRFHVRSRYDPASVAIGASIAHSGVCLTVVEAEPAGQGMVHVVEAVPETLARSTLGAWAVGTRVNLERSLRAGDELGGHLVAGHVDAVGQVRAVTPEGGGRRIAIEAPEDLAPLIAFKGSVTVDGVSLTVAHAAGNTFEVAIIPHTGAVTTLGELRAGDRVNLEADTVARYVARLLAARA